MGNDMELTGSYETVVGISFAIRYAHMLKETEIAFLSQKRKI